MTDKVDKWADKIRAVFVKHSMEKSPDLELFDTDAIIEELAQSIKQLLGDAYREGVEVGGLIELQAIPHLVNNQGTGYTILNDHIDERIKELATHKSHQLKEDK